MLWSTTLTLRLKLSREGHRPTISFWILARTFNSARMFFTTIHTSDFFSYTSVILLAECPHGSYSSHF